MRTNRLTLAFFAAAILFSMVREWGAPVACARGASAGAAKADLERAIKGHTLAQTELMGGYGR